MHENYKDTSLILFPWGFVVYLEIPHDSEMSIYFEAQSMRFVHAGKDW